jgi:hypothetical protein
MSGETGWNITVNIAHDDAVTTATARLDERGDRFAGLGRARRNPADTDVPRIGEELATARALNDLANQLIDWVSDEIEQHVGRPVTDVHI